ncbi:MAG: cysteine hydrolase [Desulfobacterales bacterium]|nr:cysteine hydrolase [Deltaproteobacteria bacterium]NNK96284.1 cysteine hydrolase [Desulfobacterales bacterium]
MGVNKDKIAVLLMDFQNKQIQNQPEQKRDILIEKAKGVLATARRLKLPIIHVEVRSRQGPPKFKPWDITRRQHSGNEDLGEREDIFKIHPDVQPASGEPVVTKRRIGPFSTTNLFDILLDLGVEQIVLLGISTGGVVLSVVRWAADMDYEIIVLADACSDADEEVHRVLVEKVFPRQAVVMTCNEFLQKLADRG